MIFKENDTIIGTWLSSCSPVIAELMAMCGYDFVTIDVEHAPVDIETTFNLLQAITSGNNECKSIVRVSGNSYSEIKRYVDAGADGIICPLITTKEEAEQLVEAVKYYPLGKRGVGYCRANNYGMNLQESIRTANDETFVCVQIEHVDAITNLEEILSVKGIDAAIIGPYDLSASMGLQGQLDHPKMEEAIRYNLETCLKAGVIPGIHEVDTDPDKVRMRIDQGYKFIAYSVDIKMISDLSIRALNKIKS
tara:strand:- start:18734 stop:19483 length:750 start_codon:yes stop_codon:yes gene_type:complete